MSEPTPRGSVHPSTILSGFPAVSPRAHIPRVPLPVLTRVADPAALLERAVDGLFPPVALGDGWPTLSAWIVLRQGGLRDDLHRLAAARGVPGWFDAPICLFSELADRWQAEDPRAPLTEPERHALLARLLDERGASLFSRGGIDAWVPAVDRFIGELVSEEVAADQFAEASMAAAQDEFARRRAEALSAIYSGWLTAIQGAARRDGRDARAALARSIVADPVAFASRIGGRRDIRLVGLADLRGGWQPLITALANSSAIDRLEIITSTTLDIPGAIVEAIPDARASAGARAASVRLIEAADTAREMERIAVEVRALVDAGTVPSRIAVIAREARPAVDAMAATLTRMGVPVTARRRTALAHTAPGRALLALLHVPCEKWGRHAIAELAEHPLLATGLDAGIVNAVGYARAMTSPEAWSTGFADLLKRAEARERGEDDDVRSPLPSSDRVRLTAESWSRVSPRLQALVAPRSLEAWCAWGVASLDDGSWGIGERLTESCGDEAVWHIELRARDRIRALLVAWEQASTVFGGREAVMDVERFLDRLLLILEQDLITMPETDAGVVVAEALAAGWRSFDHLFVVGMTAGAFPMRPTEGMLLDAEEREALRTAGIPLDATNAWRARERELFTVLCAAPRATLTLSWPALDGEGREAARSAYVDEFVEKSVAEFEDEFTDGATIEVMPPEAVLVPGYPVAATAAAIAHARVVAERERDRAARDAQVRDEGAAISMTPWNGEIDDPELQAWLAARYGETYQWSATQLETLAKCPWHWFASRLLKIEERREADDLLEPTVSGTLRHEALDLFFAKARAERGTPVVIGAADTTWVHAGIGLALTTAWEKALADGVWLGPPATRKVQYDELLASLVAYLNFEMKFNDDYAKGNTNASKEIRTGVIAGEYAFDNVALKGDGVHFLLRGMVDRIDQGVDPRIPGAERYLVAIDYKSSKFSTPGAGDSKAWDDGIVLQVPLYAKALQQRFPEKEIARMEYRTLGKYAARVHSLSLRPVKGGELADGAEAELLLAEALDAAGRRVHAARSGALPAAPAPSAGCSPYCPARDICRIPGGPR